MSFSIFLKSVARECVTMVTNNTNANYKERLEKALESRGGGISMDTKKKYEFIYT